MPNYNNYQLANSTQVPIYPGSVRGELTAVGMELQNRFDKAVATEGALRRAIKSSGALEQDMHALNGVLSGYENKIKERASKGNYEDMLRDVSMDAQDFVEDYKPFAENQQRFAAYQNELSKAKLDPAKADVLLRISKENYKGLQKDETGRWTNYFSGIKAVDDINLTEKVDKYMKDLAPSVLGTKVHKIGDVYKTINGREEEVVSGDKIAMVLNAAMRIDPELQAWMRQEQNIRSYGADKISSVSDRNLDSKIKDEMVRTGASYGDSYKNIIQDATAQDIYNSMLGYAMKHQYSKVKTEYGETGFNDIYSALASGRKLKQEQDEDAKKGNLIAVQGIVKGSGLAIEGGASIADVKKQIAGEVDSRVRNYSDFIRSVKQTPNSDGQWYDFGNGRVGIRVKDETGKWKEVDMTYEANIHRQSIEDAKEQKKFMDEAEREAAEISGFSKTSKDPKVIKYAEQYANSAVQQLINTNVFGKGSSLGLQSGKESLTELEKEKIYNQKYQEALQKQNPAGYNLYVKTLQQKLNAADETTKIYHLNDKIRKDWSESFSDMVLGLGLEGTPIKLTQVDNKGNTIQLSASGYDAIKGKLTITGFMHDENGNTVLVGRSHSNIQGKQTAGKDFIFNIPQTNIDAILPNIMPQKDLEEFKNVGELKRIFSKAPSRRISLPTKFEGVDLGVNMDVRSYTDPITNLRAWKVNVPTSEGGKEYTVNSYEGILSLQKDFRDRLLQNNPQILKELYNQTKR